MKTLDTVLRKKDMDNMMCCCMPMYTVCFRVCNYP
jgi:hypothetical protein